MMMTYAFANMTAYAQGSCAVSACSDMNSIILSLDAGILLASIIICGLIISLRAIALIAILVLVVGLIIQEVNTPWCNELAI